MVEDYIWPKNRRRRIIYENDIMSSYIYRNQLIPLFQIFLYRQKYLIKRNVCQLVVVFFAI